MDPRAPPTHHLLSPALYLPQSSAAAYPLPSTTLTYQPSQPPNPTPFPPFQTPTHPTATATYPSYAATSTVYYAPSSSNAGFPHNPPYPAVPRSHTHPPIHHHSPNDDDHLWRLRNEVIFLHALWRQGPPDSNPNPDYNLNFAGELVGNLNPHLKPSHSTAFKKKKNKNPLFRAVSDKPWPVLPVPPVPPESESGWPEFCPQPTPSIPVASEEDRARVSAIRAQQRGIDSFRSFFAGKQGPESESESDDDDPDQDDAFDHQFLEVFEGDEELKGYYLKNWGNGEFLCLVCGGSGQKVGRKYKNCVALVQHTITVSNTKKRVAHRAYGHVICQVLEWDINQLHLVSRNLCLQQINTMSNAGTSTNHSDTVAALDNHGLLGLNSTANSNLNSIGDPAGNLHLHLKPSPSTPFKKKKGANPCPRPGSINLWSLPSHPPAQPKSKSGWPEFHSCLMAPIPIVSEEEMARVSSVRVQQKGLDSFWSFFAGKHGSESESESDGDQDQDDCTDDDGGFVQFLEVFEGNEELKGYYQKNWGTGDFICLVCAGSGQKVGKKYKNCVSLVQHTIILSKMKRAAHRAYGQVICKVLGWNIDQLPLVSRNLSLQQVNGMSSAEACKDDPVGVEPNVALLVSENEQSDPSKATSDVGIDNAAERKETSDLASVLDNPDDQQINDTSNAGTSKTHSDTTEENTVAAAVLNEHGPSDPPRAGGTDTGDAILADQKETSSPAH